MTCTWSFQIGRNPSQCETRILGYFSGAPWGIAPKVSLNLRIVPTNIPLSFGEHIFNSVEKSFPNRNVGRKKYESSVKLKSSVA